MAERRADWLSVKEARTAIMQSVAALPLEMVPLLSAAGRVLGEPITSPVDLPPWDSSAMDGYAVLGADAAGASDARPVSLRMLEDIPAGGFPTRPLRRGFATRVMTGAPVPEGTDSVIRVEHTGAADAESVSIVRDDDVGRNVRRRGEDLRSGDEVLAGGAVLGAGAIGAAAAVGRSQLRVHRRPRVALASSGDELVEVDGFSEVLAGRRIVASNGYALAAQLGEAGAEVRSLGIARDDPDHLRERLLDARGCDALVTTAGISVGAHDHTRDVLESLGARVAFWRVRMKPGSPLAFGTIDALGGIPWFGLPGNPVSAMVTFELFVRPALLRMAGHRAVYRPVVRARLEEGFETRASLTHFLRARMQRDRDGWSASLTGAQGSNLLTSMVAADALVVIPEGIASVPAGGEVNAVLLGGAPAGVEAGF